MDQGLLRNEAKSKILWLEAYTCINITVSFRIARVKQLQLEYTCTHTHHHLFCILSLSMQYAHYNDVYTLVKLQYFLFLMSNAVRILDTSVCTIQVHVCTICNFSWNLYLILDRCFLHVNQVLEHDHLQN